MRMHDKKAMRRFPWPILAAAGSGSQSAGLRQRRFSERIDTADRVAYNCVHVQVPTAGRDFGGAAIQAVLAAESQGEFQTGALQA